MVQHALKTRDAQGRTHDPRTDRMVQQPGAFFRVKDQLIQSLDVVVFKHVEVAHAVDQYSLVIKISPKRG